MVACNALYQSPRAVPRNFREALGHPPLPVVQDLSVPRAPVCPRTYKPTKSGAYPAALGPPRANRRRARVASETILVCGI
jgi:hypothetical protein